ncbi:MAG: EamA family transporter, partial [Betaproteobacteria bacterium]
FMFDGWPYALLIFATRGHDLGRYARRRWPLATVGACGSLGSYGIALWAMTQAPVATVAALRETSVLFAVLLGTWLLQERISRRRVVGACVIVCSVMAVRLG